MQNCFQAFKKSYIFGKLWQKVPFFFRVCQKKFLPKFAKVCLEIISIIKNCSKTFVFGHNVNKMYAAVRQCEIDAWEALAIFKGAQCQSIGDDSM